jgi:Domain of unknown function (DUF4190)/DUF1707 SHOCT-like domain
VSSDPGPASSDFPQPSDSPGEPAPPTQPLSPAWPAPPTPAAPPVVPTKRLPATPPPPAPAPSHPGYGPPTYGGAPYGPQHGHGLAPYGSPPGRHLHAGMLAAAADRDRTMDVLKAAFTEGRLTKGEFDDRTARVLAARTYADLNALVADLPVGPGGPLAPAPYQAGYYQPLDVRRTNGFAVGALVCGIVPFFGGIPAVILGHYARGQIRKTGERGDGMAIAGLIFGYLWISLWVLIILVSIAGHS